jgi:hypothetical protein
VLEKSREISNLYFLLNRTDIFDNFATTSSISNVALGIQSDGQPNIWDFLRQVILGYELARRLQRFPNAGLTGFTPRILTTLIVADRWIENVAIILVEDQRNKGKEVAKKESVVREPEDKNAQWDDMWDLEGKTIEIHSLVHEKQTEALLRFAEILRWPYISEVREYAEDIYALLRSGTKAIDSNLFDWLYGIVLPGKWTAFKVMAALALCTPSLVTNLGIAAHYDSGVSLSKSSYWRTRTVVGRVLGCLPGVKFVCGWIGPCPPVDGPSYSYIRVKARRVAPPRRDNVIQIGAPGPVDGEESIQPGPEDDDFQQWKKDIEDESRWAVPEPPVRDMTVCSVEKVEVKELPADRRLTDRMSEDEKKKNLEYRASVVFRIDQEISVRYTLYSNPVFITAPGCHGLPHQVHTRELPKYHRNCWNIKDLKDATPADYDVQGVMIINATGIGAEVVARAWCAQTGKNALIRRASGPCFVCAYSLAGEKQLGVKVLIWVS